ncbi:MAG: 50S ribosomal protein L15 [Gammaproteobacteria bacterium]|nr:MAG: 50S ribosomal protein L15 [Gammaproteobacteria bacterium]
MYLNSIKPANGSKKSKLRLGRGIGSGLGKTCGRGHKGQKSRAGGFHKVGFEGGQMPIQRRLPKRGFSSLKSRQSYSLRLSDLSIIPETEINLDTLIKYNIVSKKINKIKIFKAGQSNQKYHFKDITVSKGVHNIMQALDRSTS